MSGERRDDRGDRYRNSDRNDRKNSYRSHENGRYKNKKRKNREDDRDSNEMGLGTTLSLLQQPELPQFNLSGTGRPASRDQSSISRAAEDNQDWQTVGRPAKKAKKMPKPESSNYPSISFSSEARLQSQIKISDLQGLLLYLLADGTAPQWISVRHRPEIRKVVVLMVPGLEKSDFEKGAGSEQSEVEPKEQNHSSLDDYYPVKLRSEKLQTSVHPFAEMFEHLWPVKTPGDDKYSKMHSPLHAMLSAPMTKNQDDKDKKGVKSAREPQGWKNKRTSISQYISSAEELLENEYVLHPASRTDDEDRVRIQEARKTASTSVADGWVDSNVATYEDGTPADKDIEQGSLTAGRDVLAMDCEMCMTGDKEFSLTRISIVSWDGSVVLDKLVKPDKPITNYLTQYSGMTEEMLAPITTTLRDIQEDLLKILHPKTVLIGHSLNSDLTALKLTHPFIIDTALLFPHPRGPPLKSSLKYLAQKYLGKEIQKGGASGPGAGHDSIEDARTCLDLVKQKCEKGPLWGTSDSAHENLFKRLARTGVRYKNQGGSSNVAGQTGGKSTAAVDWGNPKLGAGAAANFVIGCKSDEDVTEGVIRAVKGDHDGKEIPGGGVDFVWARMRELEALRGWWNNNKVIEPVVLPVAEPAVQSDLESKNEVPVEPVPEVLSGLASTPVASAGEKTGAAVEPNTSSEANLLVTAESRLAGSEVVDNVPLAAAAGTTNSGDFASIAEQVDSVASEAPQPPGSIAPERIDSTTASILVVHPSDAVSRLSERIKKIYDALPPCTALIIYSGSGDPREMSKLQQMQQTFKREYKVKKWDELSVKWTDTEEQALKKAARDARNGIGFVAVK